MALLGGSSVQYCVAVSVLCNQILDSMALLGGFSVQYYVSSSVRT
jgi:hypothetical protein